MAGWYLIVRASCIEIMHLALELGRQLRVSSAIQNFDDLIASDFAKSTE